MPLLLFGLPTHILVVHAVVVLVPLAALGAILIAVWPAARRRYGWLTVGVTAVATLTIPIATSAGEALEHALPRSAAIATHAHLGDQLLPVAIPLLVLTVALMVVDRRLRDSDRRHRRIDADSAPGTVSATRVTPWSMRALAVGVAVLTVAFAIAVAVQVVRIGDAGARAAWGGQTYVQQSGRGEG